VTAAAEATDILSRDRLVAALVATDMPNNGPTDPAIHLTDAERVTIRIALTNSSRAISEFARQLLDMYDELPPRHRYEALDLFANVVHNPHRRAVGLGAQRPAPGISR
jgi:hypothetical protein